MRLRGLSACAGLVMGLAIATWAHAAGPAATLPAKLTMGVLSERVELSLQYMSPAIALFRERLAPLGVREVALEVAPSIEEMGEWVRSGKVDVFVSTPFPVLRTARIAGVPPALHGIPLHPKRSAFYVREDGPIKTLDDLDGKKLAFTFNYSSPGYFIPILHLMQHGFVLNRPTPGRRVVYSAMTGHYVNSLYWLFFGRCDAVAVGDDDVKKVAPRLQKMLRRLDVTESYPGFLMLISPTWTPERRKVLMDYFTTMHTEKSGQEMLQNIYSCKQLVPIGPDVEKWIRDADGAITALGSGRTP